MKNKTVYIVHNVDTEGPLSESLEATFERLENIFGIKIKATEENLHKLQNGEIDLGEKTIPVKRMLDPKNLNNLDSWDKIKSALNVISNEKFRMKVPDSFGGGWIFNWFTLDHVGYTENPRKRDLGDHKVFDFYSNFLKKNPQDRIYFHYHPLPYNGKAHSCATFYFNNNHLFEILAKKIIDRNWFPTVFRAGFHTIRPDSNWFLEQWIPFDYSNQATSQKEDQPDLSDGRFGDWRRAPKQWNAYHPHHDDYQTIGNSRRWIFRCLNMNGRLRTITKEDVNEAFAEANEQGSAVLSFTNHDFRKMDDDIEKLRRMILYVSKKWKNVKFKYSNALQAARESLNIKKEEIGLEIEFVKISERESKLHIYAKNNIFGPQPFLAIKDKKNNYYYDNLDFALEKNHWHYTFDWQTFPIDEVENIGVAATNNYGTVEIVNFNVNSNEIKKVIIDN